LLLLTAQITALQCLHCDFWIVGVLVFAVLVGKRKSWGGIGTVTFLLFVVGADSLTLLEFAKYPGDS
jgi:hypothetical protein